MNYLFNQAYILSNNSLEQELLSSGFKSHYLSSSTISTSNIDDTLDYFSSDDNRYSAPDLLLVDIDDYDLDSIVTKVRSNKKYNSMLVIVISNELERIEQSFRVNSSGYLIKPLLETDISEKLNQFWNYWNSNIRPNSH